MADCVYRVLLDGRERECVARNSGHITHVYLRTQGRARFEFVDLPNVVQAVTVPASEATACVSDVGAATGSVVAAGSDAPHRSNPSGGGSSVGAGRDARTGDTVVRTAAITRPGVPPTPT